MRWRDVVAAVFQRRADPLPALAHRGIGQAHGMKPVFVDLDARDIHLDFDDVGIYPINRRADSFEEYDGDKVLSVTGAKLRSISAATRNRERSRREKAWKRRNVTDSLRLESDTR